VHFPRFHAIRFSSLFFAPLFADADFIVHHAKVATLDAKFSIVEAVAIKDGNTVDANADALKHKRDKTLVVDAERRMVLSAKDIAETKVLMTVVGGKVVYEKTS
jgi:predicted amidohydrolase YtcJ